MATAAENSDLYPSYSQSPFAGKAAEYPIRVNQDRQSDQRRKEEKTESIRDQQFYQRMRSNEIINAFAEQQEEIKGEQKQKALALRSLHNSNTTDTQGNQNNSRMESIDSRSSQAESTYSRRGSIHSQISVNKMLTKAEEVSVPRSYYDTGEARKKDQKLLEKAREVERKNQISIKKAEGFSKKDYESTQRVIKYTQELFEKMYKREREIQDVIKNQETNEPSYLKRRSNSIHL